MGQKVIYKKESTDIGHVLKIHSSTNDLNSIVIKKDYTNFEENQIYLIAKLLTYFLLNIQGIFKNIRTKMEKINGK